MNNTSRKACLIFKKLRINAVAIGVLITYVGASIYIFYSSLAIFKRYTSLSYKSGLFHLYVFWSLLMALLIHQSWITLKQTTYQDIFRGEAFLIALLVHMLISPIRYSIIIYYGIVISILFVALNFIKIRDESKISLHQLGPKILAVIVLLLLLISFMGLSPKDEYKRARYYLSNVYSFVFDAYESGSGTNEILFQISQEKSYIASILSALHIQNDVLYIEINMKKLAACVNDIGGAHTLKETQRGIMSFLSQDVHRRIPTERKKSLKGVSMSNIYLHNPNIENIELYDGISNKMYLAY